MGRKICDFKILLSETLFEMVSVDKNNVYYVYVNYINLY